MLGYLPKCLTFSVCASLARRAQVYSPWRRVDLEAHHDRLFCYIFFLSSYATCRVFMTSLCHLWLRWQRNPFNVMWAGSDPRRPIRSLASFSMFSTSHTTYLPALFLLSALLSVGFCYITKIMLIILGNGASLSCVLSLYARAYPWRPDSPGQA